MGQCPRIYNLFPLLVGPVGSWAEHLERIAGMGFDWVFVNPFHYSGFSGSLYAVKDAYRLHPLLAGDGDDPKKLRKGFTGAAANGSWVRANRQDRQELRTPAPGIPAVQVIHRHQRFTLTLRVVPDARRDVLLVQLQLEGDPQLRPYALLAPHLGGTGHDNHAAVAQYRGRRVLWAEQGPFGLALAAIDPHQNDCWGPCSAGYAGVSDGWQDFEHNGAMMTSLLVDARPIHGDPGLPAGTRVVGALRGQPGTMRLLPRAIWRRLPR